MLIRCHDLRLAIADRDGKVAIGFFTASPGGVKMKDR
jgi:hypothetical protein